MQEAEVVSEVDEVYLPLTSEREVPCGTELRMMMMMTSKSSFCLEAQTTDLLGRRIVRNRNYFTSCFN